MKMLQIALAALAIALANAASAQNLKTQIVGTWDFVVAEVDGRFAQIHVASDLPRIASNNRLTGTPEEYAEIMQGEAQTRTIDRLTADEFVNTNPNVAGGRGSASNFYKRAK